MFSRRIKITPEHDVTSGPNKNEWVSKGRDAQFIARSKLFRVFRVKGWVRLTLKIKYLENARRPEIFWDCGNGYSSEHSTVMPYPINGVSTKLIYIPENLKSLRIDPSDCESRFEINGFYINNVSKFTIVGFAITRYVWKAIKDPVFYAGIILKILRLFFSRGFYGFMPVAKDFLITGNASSFRAYIESHQFLDKRPHMMPIGQLRLRGGNFGSSLSTQNPDDNYKIAIGLVEHFGDIVACEPVVRSIREQYPGAKIFWVVRSEYRELVEAHPDIDSVITVDCLTDWIKWRSHQYFDKIIDLHVNGRICQSCRVPLIKTEGDFSIDGTNHFDYGSLLQGLSRGAGLSISDEAPRIYISNDVKKSVNRFDLPKRYAVIHASSNDSAKDWDSKHWVRLVEYLVSIDIDVVEVGLVPIIKKSIPGYKSLCGKTTLLEAAEIIKRSEIFIGVESGPGHLANAVNARSVILIGKLARFENYNPYSGAFTKDGTCLFARNLNGSAAELSYEEVLDVVMKSLAFAKPSLESTVAAMQLGDKNYDKKVQPRVIAFYLPQYHPIPENDSAWGKGFTEWRNVSKAKPFYDSQYQPRIPGELGHYDLRVPEIMEQQSLLALEHGIDGFCYYYYWFNGKRLLNLPLDVMLKNKKPEMPFCFCWANENWTRRWDGMSREVIVPQKHSYDDDVNFIRSLFSAFDDTRYIRVNGKPLLLIYRTDLFPNPAVTAEIWREEMVKAGFSGLYLVRAESNDASTIPDSIGFDASYEIPTFILPDQLRYDDLADLGVSDKFLGRIYDYRKIVEYYCSRDKVSYKRYRDPMLAWDNTPRHGERSVIFHGTTPEQYGQWIKHSYLDAFKSFEGEERLVFVNAWNEWAEGSYLEPDLKNGRAYLEANKAFLNLAKQEMV